MRRLLAALLVFVSLSSPAWAVLAIDGTPVTGSSATGTIASAAFTNSNANAVVIAVISVASGAATIPSVSGVSGCSLTWALRKKLSGTTLNYGFGTGDGTDLEIWWALAATACTAQVITATATNPGDGNISVFAISGENTSTPWDVNASLPATLTSATHAQATPTVGSVSTTNTNSVLLAFVGGYFGNAGASFPLTVPAGFTQITSINQTPTFTGQQSAQEIVSSAQSSITVAYGTQYTDFYYIVDAIQAAGAAATLPPQRSSTGLGQ